MKVVTILGTRPEIIRLSRLIVRLDAACEHVLVHTGQNFHDALSADVFRDLGVRAPDRHFDVAAGGAFAQQIGAILQAAHEVFASERPDRLLVLGDTNSALSAVIAKRMGIPVFHMEAGNRCYDDRVPEEVNRRIIDHCSDVLMPYTNRSRDNLLREGIEGRRIHVTGNPIAEVLRHHAADIERSRALARLGIEPGGYFLVTMHRAENVDDPERLSGLVQALEQLHARHGAPVVVSTHPRTRARMEVAGLAGSAQGVRFMEPFGFFDFVALEQGARCVLTDSGTVQEECCILRVPNVTIRETTERPETIDCGSNILAGVKPAAILRCVDAALSAKPAWTTPAEYLAQDVSATAAKIVLGHATPARA